MALRTCLRASCVRASVVAAVAAVVSVILPLAASAESTEDFYRGKRIRLIIGSAGGGGYDAFARTMVPYLNRHLAGNPTFVPENMPGGGGVLSANYLYNQAPKDGLVIGMVERGSAVDPIIYANLGRSKFDSRKFDWIGSPTRETGLAIVRTATGIKTVDDLKTRELIVSSTTHTAPTSVYPRTLNALFGTKFKIIEGYKSSQEALLALDRGEVNGHVSGASSGVLRAQIAPWIEAGKAKVLMQLGLTKDDAYPDALLVTDLAKTESEHEILDLMFAQQMLAYPLLAPPGTPADRVAALRTSFDETVADPGFLADAEKQKLQVKPFRGEDIEALLRKVYDTKPEVLDRFAKLLGDNESR